MIRKYLYSITITFVVAIATTSIECQAARVQWFVEVLTDPVSKKALIEARILTKDGYRLHIFKKKDDSIWARFRLPRTMRKQLTSKKLPTFWIDTFDPIELEFINSLIFKKL